MISIRHCALLLALPLSALTVAAHAGNGGQSLPACVDLGADHEIVRGGVQRFFLRDGGQYYQVEMQDSCDSLPMASRLTISSDGQDNRLCPDGSRVETNRGSCRVGEVSVISDEEFAKRKARARR